MLFPDPVALTKQKYAIMTENEKRLKREYLRLTNPDDTIEGIGTIRFYVKCKGNAKDILEKTKITLLSAVSELLINNSDTHDWKMVLPDWFVNSCAPERTHEEVIKDTSAFQKLLWSEKINTIKTENWSLVEWTSWLLPEDRIWIWWDAICTDKDTIVVAVEVTEWPFPWDALSWLFRACGAISVEAEE